MKQNILPSLLLTTLLSACNPFGDKSTEHYEMGYSDFMSHVENGNVEDIELKATGYNRQSITWMTDTLHCDDLPVDTKSCESQETENGASNDNETEISYEYSISVPVNENVYDRVDPYNVEIKASNEEQSQLFDNALLTLFLLTIVGFVTRDRWMPALKARFNNSTDKTNVTFDDVAGVDEALEEVEDIVDFLKNPKKYRERGLKVPKGVLLTGPPGNGKTLLAKAIATESGVPFLAYSGSDFNDSKWMGVGTGKIKAMFAAARIQAKKHGACIIFVDEFDSVGRTRAAMASQGSGPQTSGMLDKDNQVNQLLVELDGFKSGNDNIVFIAATNAPQALDPALTRPGRIDRNAHIAQPDIKAREKILKIYLAKHDCEPDVNPETLSRVTYNMSGAQLANLVNEAGMKCIKDGRKKISSDDIEWAKDKMLLGAEFKSRQFSDEERAVTTWHEAGHLYVGHRHPHSHPVYKATNVPRGKTLGVVHRIPDGDISMQTMAHLKADLAVGMAGRVAEELIFGKENVSTGAQGDFQQANNIAHAMVFQSGMCSELRPYFIDAQQGLSNVASPQTQQYLDEEKQKILAEAKETAKTMITEGWDDFVAVALLLDEKETLDANDIAEVLGENVKAAPLKPNLIHPDLRMEA